MADLYDIANVTISLDSAGVSRAGFGTPLFMTAQNYNSDRVREYANLSAVAEDYPTTSNGYAAAESVFGNDPSVDKFKIGRIIASDTVTPDAVEEGTVYSLTVTCDWEGRDTAIDNYTVDAGYTALSTDTLADVVTNLVADINAVLGDAGSPNSALVIVTELTDSFKIARGDSNTYPDIDYVITDLSSVTLSPTADSNRETLVEAYNEIIDVDNDFYVVATEVHKDTDVGSEDSGDAVTQILALADTVKASEYKLYFVGSAASESITDDYTEGDTPASTNDILAYLTDGQYSRTVGWWSDKADEDFNELSFAGYNLPFDAGSIVWGNIQVPVSNAKNSNGYALTSTQEQRLADRNANWPSIKGGVVYAREGKVSGGEWIDIIRGRDNLKSDLESDLFDTLTNQQGQKIPYTDKGINVIAGVVETRLNDYKVNRNFLTDPITITVPKAADILDDDKKSRTLNGMSFTATLAGAIMLVDLQGSLEI